MAEMTFERLRTRVLPCVSSQLIAPREGPGTSWPRAGVWLLPRVGASVCLQVRALCVHLQAARILAPMLPPMPLCSLALSQRGKRKLLKHSGETDGTTVHQTDRRHARRRLRLHHLDRH